MASATTREVYAFWNAVAFLAGMAMDAEGKPIPGPKLPGALAVRLRRVIRELRPLVQKAEADRMGAVEDFGLRGEDDKPQRDPANATQWAIDPEHRAEFDQVVNEIMGRPHELRETIPAALFDGVDEVPGLTALLDQLGDLIVDEAPATAA